MKAGTIILAIVILAVAGSLYYSAGNSAGNQSILPSTASNGAQAELYICPQDNCAEKLVSFLDESKSYAHVMIYSFTKQDIADELVALKERGIEVIVLADKTQAGNKSSKLGYLELKGVKVKEIDLPGYSIFHHKVSIIDGNAFSTGSFNYTENADSGSAENLVIIKNRELGQRMESEFQKYWNAD
ncbi:MAG: phospholipase D-like domain-containing protein [archaeon]